MILIKLILMMFHGRKKMSPIRTQSRARIYKKKVAKKVLFATIVAIGLNLVHIECKSKSLEIV